MKIEIRVLKDGYVLIASSEQDIGNDFTDADYQRLCDALIENVDDEIEFISENKE